MLRQSWIAECTHHGVLCSHASAHALPSSQKVPPTLLSSWKILLLWKPNSTITPFKTVSLAQKTVNHCFLMPPLHHCPFCNLSTWLFYLWTSCRLGKSCPWAQPVTQAHVCSLNARGMNKWIMTRLAWIPRTMLKFQQALAFSPKWGLTVVKGMKWTCWMQSQSTPSLSHSNTESRINGCSHSTLLLTWLSTD